MSTIVSKRHRAINRHGVVPGEAIMHDPRAPGDPILAATTACIAARLPQ